MSLPKNNLDDLKRKVKAGSGSRQQLQAHLSESAALPKTFKFKTCTGPNGALEPTDPGSFFRSIDPCEREQRVITSPVGPADCAMSRPVSRSEPVGGSQLQKTFKPSVMMPRHSTSPSSIPSKRLSLECPGDGLDANKRKKLEDSPQNVSMHDVCHSAQDMLRSMSEPGPKLLSEPPASRIHPSSASADRMMSPLFADYEKHKTENLKLMLASNISSRMDVLDKLLSTVDGYEPGVDRAMLQESSDNLYKRITVIKTVINNRAASVIPGRVPRTDTSSTPPCDIFQRPQFNDAPVAKCQNPPLSLSMRTSTDHDRPIHYGKQPNKLLETSVPTPMVTKGLSISHGTIATPPSAKNVKPVRFTSQDTEDEDAMWAQFDDVSTEVLDLPAASASGPLHPIGNVLDERSSPGKSQGLKTPESLSKDIDLFKQKKTPYYPEIMRTLRDVFKLESFRPNQLEAISATMSGKDVFVLMPTGGGKSLCYQVPAVCPAGTTRGVSVVVSPLIALMIDQVHHLEQRGIDVALFNSDQDHERSRDAHARLLSRERRPKLLYVTPEKLHKSNSMKSLLAKLYSEGALARFVIDEAHCVSTWGRDFREAYQDLDRLRQEYPKTPIMALTATANEQVMNDVINKLGIQKCIILTQSFNRPNLHYEIRSKKRNVIAEINEYIRQHHHRQTGIIYCLSRNKCEEVAKELREKYGLRAKHYHAQMSVEDKQRAQAAWQSGECDIIVATIAFGMGIDMPEADVRFVMHHSLPMSLDGYYQETGRAGRDGKPATCILFYSYGDTKILFKLIQDGEKSAEERKRQEDGVRCVVQYCQNEMDCRRVQVLSYFGQTFDPKDCRKRCNNCLSAVDSVQVDMSEAASKAIRLVKDIIGKDRNVTKLHCLDAFRGANLKAIRDKGHDQLPLFGAGAALSREQGERLFDHLLSLGAFNNISVMNKSGWNTMYMQLGPNANDFLTGKRKLKMMVKVNNNSGENSRANGKMKPTRRKSGTVVSVNRSRADDIFDDDLEDCSADAALCKDVVDTDDIFDFGSSPSRAPAPKRAQSSKRRKEEVPPRKVQKEPLHALEDSGDALQLCYKELLEVRDEVARDLHLSAEDLIEESLLQLISAILPTDHGSFKEVLNENLSRKNADEIWNRCGRRLLEVCTNHKMHKMSSVARYPARKFDAMKLHAKFDYHSSTSGPGTPQRSRNEHGIR